MIVQAHNQYLAGAKAANGTLRLSDLSCRSDTPDGCFLKVWAIAMFIKIKVFTNLHLIVYLIQKFRFQCKKSGTL